jgi:hypothetical protein
MSRLDPADRAGHGRFQGFRRVRQSVLLLGIAAATVKAPTFVAAATAPAVTVAAVDPGQSRDRPVGPVSERIDRTRFKLF